jgi:hypothetical protein
VTGGAPRLPVKHHAAGIGQHHGSDRPVGEFVPHEKLIRPKSMATVVVVLPLTPCVLSMPMLRSLLEEQHAECQLTTRPPFTPII